MLNILHETQILGPVGIFSLYKNADVVQLEAYENYQKRSHRNRYSILGANGVLTLSIPLQKGKNNKTIIKDVRIAYDELWVSNHINTIKSCYGNAPYFLFYADDFFSLLRRKPPFLWDLNLFLLEYCINILGINIEINETDQYRLTPQHTKDYRNSFEINHPKENNTPYPQVFEDKFGFISGLSILDLIFCVGQEGIFHL